jgi:hypothetical protein
MPNIGVKPEATVDVHKQYSLESSGSHAAGEIRSCKGEYSEK